MTINILAIIFLLITILCMVTGCKKGMLTILYAAIAWVFVFWFISNGTGFIKDYIYENTELSTTINNKIAEKLEIRYERSEEEESGTGTQEVLKLVPSSIRDNLQETVEDSIDSLIAAIANELTDTAINGICTIIAILIAILIVWLGHFLVKALGVVPGIKGINHGLGFLAGILEALLIIWTIMFVASCFPTTMLGEYIVTNSQDNDILVLLYENNLITSIIN